MLVPVKEARRAVVVFLALVAAVAATFVGNIVAGHPKSLSADKAFDVWGAVLALSVVVAAFAAAGDFTEWIGGTLRNLRERRARTAAAVAPPSAEAKPFAKPADSQTRSASPPVQAEDAAPVRAQVFICGSSSDDDWRTRLVTHLRPLTRNGLLDVWSEDRIRPGDDRQKEIETALARAKVALLLVSADFLASDFISEYELPKLLEAAEQGGCRIIPVLVKPSLFADQSDLARYQPANPGDATLSQMSRENADRVLVDLSHFLMTLTAPS
jgi:hypothetical protein